ncbi:Hsp70 family protein, partial [Staphylococcus epidermidis]|uniref:Hsp70 family protein n=1 Tax=Staphylococcus epidermidis TaxID=1282 RepID=UPI0011A6A9BA
LHKTQTHQNLLLFHLPPPPFHLSILHLPHPLFQVLSTAAHNKLPPDHFHQVIIHCLLSQFNKHNPLHLSQHKIPLQTLKHPPQKPKKHLSPLSQTQISLPF